MTGLEVLQGVQFVSAKGKRFAVLNAEDWEALSNRQRAVCSQPPRVPLSCDESPDPHQEQEAGDAQEPQELGFPEPNGVEIDAPQHG